MGRGEVFKSMFCTSRNENSGAIFSILILFYYFICTEGLVLLGKNAFHHHTFPWKQRCFVLNKFERHLQLRSYLFVWKNEERSASFFSRTKSLIPCYTVSNGQDPEGLAEIMRMKTIDIKLELQIRGAEHRDLYEKKDLAERLLKVKQQDIYLKETGTENTVEDLQVDPNMSMDEVRKELKLLGCKVSSLWGDDRTRRELARARQVAQISTEDRRKNPDKVATRGADDEDNLKSTLAEPEAEPTHQQKEALFLELSSMDSESIMDELEDRNIKFSVLDPKPALVNLLLDARLKEPFVSSVQKESDEQSNFEEMAKESSIFNSLLEDASHLSTRQLLTRLDSLNVAYSLYMSRPELERLYAKELMKSGGSSNFKVNAPRKTNFQQPAKPERTVGYSETKGRQRAFRSFEEAYAWSLHLTKKQICEELEARGIAAERSESTRRLATMLADELMTETNLSSSNINRGTNKKQSFADFLERTLEMDKDNLLEELQQLGADLKEDLAQSDLARYLAQMKFWQAYDSNPEDGNSSQTMLILVARKLWSCCLMVHDFLIKPILEDLKKLPFANIINQFQTTLSKFLSKGKRAVLLSAVNTCMAASVSLARWAGGDMVPPKYVIFLCTSVGLLARKGLWVPAFLLVMVRALRTTTNNPDSINNEEAQNEPGYATGNTVMTDNDKT